MSACVRLCVLPPKTALSRLTVANLCMTMQKICTPNLFLGPHLASVEVAVSTKMALNRVWHIFISSNEEINTTCSVLLHLTEMVMWVDHRVDCNVLSLEMFAVNP